MTLPTDWQNRVDALWLRLDETDPVAFVAEMQTLAAERGPNDPAALFELASANDSVGYEAQAEPLYRQALAAGLDGSKRRRATIQLASTLRNLGQHGDALSLLQAEQRQASDDLDDAVTAILALVLADLGREREALALTLTALAPHLPRYTRSVTNYAKALLP